MAERLPGFGAIRRRKGRNEEIVAVVVRHLRDHEQYGPNEKALATLARTVGASLDRLERDPDRSEHNVATVARVQLQVLEAMRLNVTGTASAFDEFLSSLQDTET